MSVFTNKQHFLHGYVSFMESTGMQGKNHGFSRFLKDLRISCNGESWNKDHSQIDWNRLENHYQFFFDFEENDIQVQAWLNNSELINHEYLYTWLSWDDPIIKIKTSEFIKKWEWFYIASVEGMILITEDGTKFLEFTDDYKHHLNSNFEIKPSSKTTND